MNYIAEINAFERWLETNHLSAVSQLLWYKLIMLFNRCGWLEWIGFAGYWTLEIQCIHPLVIYPDIEVCQIYYHTIEGDFDLYNSGKYQNNKGIQASLMYRDFEKEKKYG